MRSKTCLKPRQCERARLAGFVTLLVVILAATGCTPATGPTREGTGIAVAAPDARLPGTLDRGGIAVPARGKFILVNIPAFELVALEDGRTALRSRVIVGRAAAPTPELLSSMYAVKFNPSWTPTPAMVREEGARPMPPGRR